MKSSARKANAHLRRDLKNEERRKRNQGWVGIKADYELADPPAKEE